MSSLRETLFDNLIEGIFKNSSNIFDYLNTIMENMVEKKKHKFANHFYF